jgi:hypothetical protein
MLRLFQVLVFAALIGGTVALPFRKALCLVCIARLRTADNNLVSLAKTPDASQGDPDFITVDGGGKRDRLPVRESTLKLPFQTLSRMLIRGIQPNESLDELILGIVIS